jgi:hypothetical protein
MTATIETLLKIKDINSAATQILPHVQFIRSLADENLTVPLYTALEQIDTVVTTTTLISR